jgi:hypothetical protein
MDMTRIDRLWTVEGRLGVPRCAGEHALPMAASEVRTSGSAGWAGRSGTSRTTCSPGWSRSTARVPDGAASSSARDGGGGFGGIRSGRNCGGCGELSGP